MHFNDDDNGKHEMAFEEELERLMFTKADSVILKKFLQQEGDLSQKLQLELCHVMNDINSVENIELHKKQSRSNNS